MSWSVLPGAAARQGQRPSPCTANESQKSALHQLLPVAFPSSFCLPVDFLMRVRVPATLDAVIRPLPCFALTVSITFCRFLPSCCRQAGQNFHSHLQQIPVPLPGHQSTSDLLHCCILIISTHPHISLPHPTHLGSYC